jgi:uncharacterized circularly permuted ATP-grasp superfamily protein/uncharacterized alpha-E superfamily protein
MTGMPSTIAGNGLDALLADYTPLPGVPDELMDGNGQIRDVWRSFVHDLGALPKEELKLCFDRGSQYLRDAGVFFRHYAPDSDAIRDWPLSHIPLLISDHEWQGISAALSERADILEMIMADIYGPQRLVQEHLLPAELIARNPEWIRPMVGVRPGSGNFLHFVAFDIGRGPDGQWWVLGDRAQAPSGAGFALETRIATARSFSTHMARANVHRLAGFFRDFRDALLDLRQKEGSRVAILTPGPLNDSYYEHAYIARYLGFMLVQGEDLGIRNGGLNVRTVGGWQPVSVLWRRLDSQWADPLELLESSKLGTPGMMETMRSGALTMINAIGSGVLEMRALMAFMPRIAEYFTGKPLALPNIATWWCGGDNERAYVKNNLERMTIDSAFSTRLPFEHGSQVVIAGKTVDGALVNPNWIDAHSGELVAQEIGSLSTAPAIVGDRLVPRPMSLRVFLARTSAGWKVMPGGFARIGREGEDARVAMQSGGSVCDVWVVSEKNTKSDTLLPIGNQGFRRTKLGALPSRAADNLFWLGRYVERAEQKVRLLRAYHLRLAESGNSDLPIVVHLADYLSHLGMETAEPLPGGLLADIRSAIGSAGSIRDRFSTDGWSALVDLHRTGKDMAPRLDSGDDAARAMSVLLRKISGFSGLVHENMYRFTGWRFLSIGRAVERAGATSGFLAAFASDDAPEGAFDLAIEAGDSIMSHRRRYAVSTTRETVLDLLLLDDMNPRSVLHQLRAMHGHVEFLPEPKDGQRMTPFQRQVLTLETELATAAADEITADRLESVLQATAGLSDLLAESYLH